MRDDTTTRATILVVDDTPDNITVVDGILRPEFDVRAATSGKRALEILRASPQPDLVLLDILMPGMDGFEVLQAIRSEPSTRRLPVIFVTALEGDDHVERGLQGGAVDYVAKPVRADVLRARVRTHLRLSRQRRLLEQHSQLLEQAVAERTRQMQLVQDVTLRALAELAELRDDETGDHVHRTQGYVEALVSSCIRRGQCAPMFGYVHGTEIIRAAPLHDIGKIGIPDAILRKPGKLTPDEYDVMKTHAAIGAQALERAMAEADAASASEAERVSALRALSVARDLVLYHHERWDGSGYPHGLAGTDIPIGARIMAVADVFDALMSVRPYKPAMTFDQAAGIIREGRGTHFDPDVVDAFEDSIGAFEALARMARAFP